MSTDPILALRAELVGAAERRIGVTGPAPAPVPRRRPRRWRPRRPLLIALGGLVIAGSAAAAAVTGVPFGSGTTPDGSTYTTEQFLAAPSTGLPGPPAGADCRRVQFRDRTGAVTTRSTACHSPGTTGSAPLEVGFTVTPGHGLLIEGTVAADVARVTVTGVAGPIALVDAGGGRRKFSTLATGDRPTVTAFDAGGRPVATYVVPM